MISTGLIALLAATQGNTASLGVGAIVVRPAPQPVLAIARGAATLSNAEGVIVTAEGGTARHKADGTILVTPAGAGTVTVTLTY